MADCEMIRGSVSQLDLCPDCCTVCHEHQRLWNVVWKTTKLMVCCTVVTFALKQGARVDHDEPPRR